MDNANLTEADKKHFNSALVSMGNLYDKRNTLAHQYFKAAPEGNGVIFSITHVKGGTTPLDTPWAKADFETKGSALNGMMATATQMRDALTGRTFTFPKRHHHLWGQMMYEDRSDVWQPTPRNIGPALWAGIQQNQPQSLPGSDPDPANPKTDDKTPDTPQEK